MRFPFAFDPAYRAASLPFLITPARAWVEVDGDRLSARFGFWQVTTPLANVAGTTITGPYKRWKTMGPGRLSVVDLGLTFASNGRRGVCICFAEPVRGLLPTGHLRHPALTVTVADLDGLVAALATPEPAR